ncbi:MAG: ATP-binding cassette domain-containing protein [Chitinivibrionales bacterium]|nr:ATP-binding cassette domain-containing protein [Chitinivibrionales bacterium]
MSPALKMWPRLSFTRGSMRDNTVSISDALKFYFSFLARHKWELPVLAPIFAVKHAIYLAYPIAVKFIIDNFIPAERIDLIFGTIVLGAILGGVNYVLHRIYVSKTTVIIKSITRDIRNMLVHKLQMLSMQYHSQHESGRYFSKIMVDVERSERFGEMLFGLGFAVSYTLLFTATVLYLTNWKILVLYLLCLPVYFLIYRHFRRLFATLQRKARLANEDLSQSISQFIQTSTLTRIHGEEEYEKERIDDKNIHIIGRYREIRKGIASFAVIIETFSQLFLMFIVAVCAIAIIRGQMQVGALVLFLQYINRMTATVNNLVNQFPVLTEFSESINSIKEVLDAPDVELNENKTPLSSVHGQIDFEQVHFAYAQGPLVFADLTYSITTGQTIGLVGGSGSGKTTFVNLVLGLLRAQQGHVRIDGYDVNAIDMRSVRKHVGVVTQEPILFRANLFENIAHGRRQFEENDVYEAARMADADEFIRNLPEGYHTIIGERGATLSGGQKQRIVIARAIFRRPAILILDEATSSLDSISEKEVQQCIQRLLGRQTTLIVAHRLSTIFHVDMILVFHNGEIVEYGTHNALIDRQGIYAGMLSTQVGLGVENLQSLKT